MSRRLVVCADGTWNTPDETDGGKVAPTNVYKMYLAVKGRPTASDGTLQMFYYNEGIGAQPNAFERGLDTVGSVFHVPGIERNLVAGITGEGIDRHIKDCYRWLVVNFVPGDDIYLFGFSRGAYTVRSLAGLIRKCGILKGVDDRLTDKAYDLYRQRDEAQGADSPEAVAFRQANSYETGITFIGVWDTVGELGIPVDLPILATIDKAQYEFHDVSLSSRVKYAYHSLAIDERRKAFSPTLWQQQSDGVTAGQVLEQTWFAGTHSNIGGGYADCGLSDNTFLWMAQGAKRAGLELDDAYVASTITSACWNGVVHESATPPELWELTNRTIAAGRSKADVDAGTPDPTRETLHETASQRYKKTVPPATGPWDPANVADYYQRFGIGG